MSDAHVCSVCGLPIAVGHSWGTIGEHRANVRSGEITIQGAEDFLDLGAVFFLMSQGLFDGRRFACDLPAMPSLQSRDRPSNRLEIIMGRSLAICLHPVAAWLSRSQRKRLVLVGGYVGAGYVLVLIALLLLSV
jgi:hypothetical protein